LAAITPRPTMVVSGTEDKYSRDADQVVAKVAGDSITELRVDRGHALDQERFDAIVEWIVGRASDGGDGWPSAPGSMGRAASSGRTGPVVTDDRVTRHSVFARRQARDAG